MAEYSKGVDAYIMLWQGSLRAMAMFIIAYCAYQALRSRTLESVLFESVAIATLAFTIVFVSGSSSGAPRAIAGVLAACNFGAWYVLMREGDRKVKHSPIASMFFVLCAFTEFLFVRAARRREPITQMKRAE